MTRKNQSLTCVTFFGFRIWIKNKSRCQNTQSQIFGLEHFKLSLDPQPSLGQFSSTRCGFAVTGSQQSRTEGKFEEKLWESCNSVIGNDREFPMTVIIKGKLHSLGTLWDHSRAHKCTVC